MIHCKTTQKQFLKSFLMFCIGVACMVQTSGASWTDNISIKGDFRYRFEFIDQENKDESRYRNRIRARLYLSGKVHDKLNVTIGLATGSNDPVSTNQSLDGSFSTKNLGLDLAFFDWQPIKPLKIFGGKMKNPFFKPGKTSLIWDGDLRPEGLALELKTDSESLNFFTNAAYFWVEERSSEDDTMLMGLQAGIDIQPTKGNLRFKLGCSYFSYSELKGYNAIYDDDSFGNSMDDEGNYLFDYNLFEVFFDMGIKFKKLKLGLVADYVNNTDPDDNNTAYLIGINLGKIVGKYKWKIGYNYRDVESDSVFGTFSDSDFIGGGTGGNGHILQAAISLSKKISVSTTCLINSIDTDDTELNYDRFQFDIKYKF
ncbi:putative porin [bacterium]|nr:putative porin [bacterium]